MPIVNITPPATEPLTVAEAKLHVKESWDDAGNDAKIAMAIQAVREMCENDTRRAFITQSWSMALDAFPTPQMNVSSATWYGPQWGTAPGPLLMLKPDGTTGYEIWLPLPPLQTVDSVKYVAAETGILTTLDPSLYLADTVSAPGRLVPAYDTTWPATRAQPNAVQITFTAGYGPAAADVPACARAWMLCNIGSIYEHRESNVIVARGKIDVLPFVDGLLDPIRVRRYF